jgi:hypothetical protein
MLRVRPTTCDPILSTEQLEERSTHAVSHNRSRLLTLIATRLANEVRFMGVSSNYAALSEEEDEPTTGVIQVAASQNTCLCRTGLRLLVSATMVSGAVQPSLST